MIEAIAGIAVVAVLLVLGFYFTRGGGGVPGGVDDPAAQERLRRRWPDGPRDAPEPFIGERKPPAEAEADPTSQDSEAWERERERYQEKGQTRDS